MEIWGGTSEEGAVHLQKGAAKCENFGKLLKTVIRNNGGWEKNFFEKGRYFRSTPRAAL